MRHFGHDFSCIQTKWEIAKQAGINAVVQPGGSIKDQLSIDYAMPTTWPCIPPACGILSIDLVADHSTSTLVRTTSLSYLTTTL
jgi:hypothetical protein